MNATPELSVVLVAHRHMAALAPTLRHLRAQSARDRLELVIVAPDRAVVDAAAPGLLDGFAAVRTVPVGPIDNVDRAVARGVMHATAPFVALIEDHAFPAPDWAAHVIAAHATPVDAVGPAILNGNPRRLASWANYLLSYAAWSERAAPGPVPSVPGHNSSFRTDLLASFGDRLGDLLQRDGGLMKALRDRGATFLREPRASVAHLNPSTWPATARLRFHAGRAWAAGNADRNRWTRARRVAYAAAGPLIPSVRLRRELHTLRNAANGAGSTLRTLVALSAALALDAAGQMAGYAFGPGSSRAFLASFEMDRIRHLAPSDRPLLEPDRPISPESAP